MPAPLSPLLPLLLQDLGPFVANMYLAEDRILCFEIVAKKHRQWILKYIVGAVRGGRPDLAAPPASPSPARPIRRALRLTRPAR